MHIDKDELMKQRDLSQPQFCACANLRMASRAVTQFYDEILKPAGLRATQFALLSALLQVDQIAITELAERLVMDRTTLTRNLEPLEQKKLIDIYPGEDRRIRLVNLTERGRQALAKATPLWQQAQSQVTQALGEDRSNSLLDNLLEMVALTHQ